MALKENPDKKPKEVLKLMRREEEKDQGVDEDKIIDQNNESETKNDEKILQSLRNLKSNHERQGEVLSVEDLKNIYDQNKMQKNNSNEAFIIDALFGNGLETPICLVFSSRTCLKYLHEALSTRTRMLALDGTFKLNSLGFPMLCATTLDASHKIFPLAFAPSSSECEETITFLLKSLVKGYKFFYNKTLDINYVMTDCAIYMYTSVSQVFPSIKSHLSCFFHVKENQRKRSLAEYRVSKEDRKDILFHLDIMHELVSQEHFKKYWKLFNVLSK